MTLTNLRNLQEVLAGIADLFQEKKGELKEDHDKLRTLYADTKAATYAFYDSKSCPTSSLERRHNYRIFKEAWWLSKAFYSKENNDRS